MERQATVHSSVACCHKACWMQCKCLFYGLQHSCVPHLNVPCLLASDGTHDDVGEGVDALLSLASMAHASSSCATDSQPQHDYMQQDEPSVQYQDRLASNYNASTPKRPIADNIIYRCEMFAMTLACMHVCSLARQLHSWLLLPRADALMDRQTVEYGATCYKVSLNDYGWPSCQEKRTDCCFTINQVYWTVKNNQRNLTACFSPSLPCIAVLQNGYSR